MLFHFIYITIQWDFRINTEMLREVKIWWDISLFPFHKLYWFLPLSIPLHVFQSDFTEKMSIPLVQNTKHLGHHFPQHVGSGTVTSSRLLSITASLAHSVPALQSLTSFLAAPHKLLAKELRARTGAYHLLPTHSFRIFCQWWSCWHYWSECRWWDDAMSIWVSDNVRKKYCEAEQG